MDTKATAAASLLDRLAIERAGIQALRKAAKLHRLENVPLIVGEGDEPMEVSADEFERLLDAREARLRELELASGANTEATSP